MGKGTGCLLVQLQQIYVGDCASASLQTALTGTSIEHFAFIATSGTGNKFHGLLVFQGDGTALIFEDDNRVFTFSMHCQNNFPSKKQNSDLDIGLSVGTEVSVHCCFFNAIFVCLFGLQHLDYNYTLQRAHGYLLR